LQILQQFNKKDKVKKPSVPVGAKRKSRVRGRSSAKIPLSGPHEMFTPLNAEPCLTRVVVSIISSGRRPFNRGDSESRASLGAGGEKILFLAELSWQTDLI
jgi:hypothetical protein